MIEYTDSVENITCQMLEGFFGGWKKPRDPALQGFYSKFGMVPSVGMIVRDY